MDLDAPAVRHLRGRARQRCQVGGARGARVVLVRLLPCSLLSHIVLYSLLGRLAHSVFGTMLTGTSSTVVIKIILGVQLLGYATRRRADMEAREAADVVNDFGRDPIGEGKEEQVRVAPLTFPNSCLNP